MGHASQVRLLPTAALLVALLAATPSLAQELRPGMEPYLKLTLRPADAYSNTADLTNLYSSALIAVSWRYTCTPGETTGYWRDSTGYSGGQDVTSSLTNPWETGQTLRIQGAVTGCKGGVTAAIFADGKEIGDTSALRQIHNCRDARREEVRKVLYDDISNAPLAELDIVQSIRKLKARRAEFSETTAVDHDEGEHVADRGCQISALDYLISSFEDYGDSASKEPTKYGPRKNLFLQYWKELEQALGSPTYPATRTWWKGF